MKKNNDFDDSVDISDDFGFEQIDEVPDESDADDNSGHDDSGVDETDDETDDSFEDDERDEYDDRFDDEDGDLPADDEFPEDDYASDDTFDEPENEEDYVDGEEEEDMSSKDAKPRKRNVVALVGWIFLAVVIVFALWIFVTPSGKHAVSKLAGKFISENIGTEVKQQDEKTPVIDIADVPDEEQTGIIVVGENGEIIVKNSDGTVVEKVKEPRAEDYVRTYLIFGLEEIDGAANSDAMMLVSINTKDNTIKLTSLLRDTYVNIPGWEPNKLNSVYARGAKGAATAKEAKNNGAALLIRVIEDTYDVDITGYACVNFASFEKIIDRLGGLDIELGEEEAHYLNTTNYISDPANRHVSPGVNHLNGNQVMGYVRVRKVVTVGGANNDYGRTVRQRRVINAIIAKYKSAGISEMVKIMKDCLGYVYTGLTEEQITEAIELVVSNAIFKTKSMRLPTGELFKDSDLEGIFNGKRNITYALVLDGFLDENIKLFHQFLFLDEDESASKEK